MSETTAALMSQAKKLQSETMTRRGTRTTFMFHNRRCIVSHKMTRERMQDLPTVGKGWARQKERNIEFGHLRFPYTLRPTFLTPTLPLYIPALSTTYNCHCTDRLCNPHQIYHQLALLLIIEPPFYPSQYLHLIPSHYLCTTALLTPT